MRYVFEGCVLDTEQYVLDKSGLSIALQPKVFQVLLYLLQHRNRVVAKQKLYEQVWPEQFISDATVESVIKAIRRAVGDDGRTQWCIQTRRGQGYRFVATVTVMQAEAQRVAEHVSQATTLVQGPIGPEQGETSLDVLPVDASHVNTSHVAPLSPAALRRQLTVMFCHLMDAGALAEQLDPEYLREVMLAYHTACDAVITRFEEHTAQYLGDGLLVYFGYPMAHEDDAVRAVWSALGIVEAVESLNTQLNCHYGARLSVRLGVHTGPVVVSPPRETNRQDTLAWGMTPNIAARLQVVVAPNAVVLSGLTYALIEGYVICHALGKWAFEGIAQPIQAYQALRLSGAESRLEIAGRRGRTPFVGRTTELLVLRERWEHVTAGMGQVVLLTVEAGIGKSRLVRHFQATFAEPHLWLEGRGSPHYQHSAFHAVRALLKHFLPQEAEDLPDDDRLKTLETKLAHLHLRRDEMIPLLAPLLDLSLPPERYAPVDLNPQDKRHNTFEALLTLVSALAVEQPVVLLVEDLHCVDPSTLEFLSLLIDQGPMVRVYSLFTFRPDLPRRGEIGPT